MRNKLKKIWNKEDGFTLVELLGVIVILGIILAIAIPAIGNIVDNARKDTNDAQEELVIDAAQMYFLENSDASTVTVQKLIEDKYLEKKEGIDEKDTVTKEEDGSYKLNDNK